MCIFITPSRDISCSSARFVMAEQVREACSILDIDVEFFPCPKDGPTWRAKVRSDISLNPSPLQLSIPPAGHLPITAAYDYLLGHLWASTTFIHCKIGRNLAAALPLKPIQQFKGVQGSLGRLGLLMHAWFGQCDREGVWGNQWNGSD